MLHCFVDKLTFLKRGDDNNDDEMKACWVRWKKRKYTFLIMITLCIKFSLCFLWSVVDDVTLCSQVEMRCALYCLYLYTEYVRNE